MSEKIGNSTNYRNVHYEADAEYTIHIAKTLLKLIGIWPRRDTFLDNVKMYIQTTIVFSLMCFLLVPHVIYTYFDCENLTKYMKVIAAQIFSLLAVIKFWTVIFNRKEIRFCLDQIEIQYRDVKCEEDRLVMTNCAKIGRFFTMMYLSLSYTGALPYHIILPLISERIVKADNTTQIPLPYLSDYIFFTVENSPIYEITFVLQIFISSIILSTNCGIYSLIASITMHCCGLFEVTSRRIETLHKWNKCDLHDRVVDIVQYHLEAIGYSALIGKSLSIVFLSEMVGCTIIICFLEFGVIMEWEDHKTLSTLTYFVLMTSIFVNVFIISFIGDRLKQESERIGETSYFLPWYDFPVDVAKNINTIMLRTRLPSCLSGANILEISLQAFCDVSAHTHYFKYIDRKLFEQRKDYCRFVKLQQLISIFCEQ
ncbi:odorant receptor 85b-like isoform X1 [Bombus impatiens]|uniref:Odorant receptor n=1 Tax=Bombus impatiens TaxID=132113 RepID=A0A6P3V870_BOMIM|nr:odorant receptor 85b-like isoform X1 [Bombus impatiens]